MEHRNKEKAVKQNSLNDSSESLVPPRGLHIWWVSLSYSAETKALAHVDHKHTSIYISDWLEPEVDE